MPALLVKIDSTCSAVRPRSWNRGLASALESVVQAEKSNGAMDNEANQWPAMKVVLAVDQGRSGVETGLLRLWQTVNDRMEAVNRLWRAAASAIFQLSTCQPRQRCPYSSFFYSSPLFIKSFRKVGRLVRLGESLRRNGSQPANLSAEVRRNTHFERPSTHWRCLT